MCTVVCDDENIVIRINKDAIDKKTLSSFLEFVEMEEMRRKSQLTAEKAINGADAIWDREGLSNVDMKKWLNE